jgi:hypothetical protein
VARRHPSLILFPLAANFVFCARNLVPFADSLQRPDSPGNSVLAAVKGMGEVFVDLRNSPHLFAIAVYFFAALLSYTFFTVALYHELMRAYAGERPSVVRGLRFACGRFGPILSWTVLASPAWMMVELGTHGLGLPLRIVAGVAGLGWGLAAIYANAVLLRGRVVDPTEVLRRSWGAVRQTWMELLALYLTMVVIGIAAHVVAKVLPGLIHSQGLLQGVAAVGRTTYRVAVNMVVNVYVCTLYICATEGAEPRALHAGDMDAAWEIRPR